MRSDETDGGLRGTALRIEVAQTRTIGRPTTQLNAQVVDSCEHAATKPCEWTVMPVAAIGCHTKQIPILAPSPSTRRNCAWWNVARQPRWKPSVAVVVISATMRDEIRHIDGTRATPIRSGISRIRHMCAILPATRAGQERLIATRRLTCES